MVFNCFQLPCGSSAAFSQQYEEKILFFLQYLEFWLTCLTFSIIFQKPFLGFGLVSHLEDWIPDAGYQWVEEKAREPFPA